MKTSLPELYRIFLQHGKISTDTRNIEAGTIFFALKGETYDGNEFAVQAIDKGASFAIINNKKYQTSPRCLLVDNVENTLQQLAAHHRMQLKIPVIGITGTNGKTTTKELTGNVLARKFKTVYTQGNLNNHIGVPLSVLSINQETEIAVIEMGANHVGEIAALCQISKPTHGIITNIGRAHLDGFGGFEGVIKAKSELYHFIKENGGHIFRNNSDDLLLKLGKEIKTITYGSSPGAGLHGEITEKSPFLSVKIWFNSGPRLIQTRLVGEYNFANVMAAATIGQYFGVDSEMIAEALECYSPSNNRSQWLQSTHNQIIMDAYNANPTSMESSILSFSDFPGTEKIAILGDMRELGHESLKEHRYILDLALTQNFQSVFLVGSQFCQVSKGLNVHGFQNVEEACEFFKAHPLQNKTLLIKASRSTKLEKLLEVL
jgi:UDP-N-acetylmuramoyl-tripeptide--D-alanyl-D-alanine ligase